MTLYELTGEWLRLLDIAEEDDDPVALQDTLETLEGEIQDKVDSYCAVIRKLDSDIDYCTNEIHRISDRINAMIRNKDLIKQHLQNTMEITGQYKIKTKLNTVSIQRNGGYLPVILDVEQDDLPKDCFKTIETVDYKAIRAKLDAGECDFAHYAERGRSLRIR